MIKKALIATLILLSLPVVATAHDGSACICLRQVYFRTLFGTAYFTGRYFEATDACVEAESTEAIWYGPYPQNLTYNCSLSGGCQCKFLGQMRKVIATEPPKLPKFSLDGAKKYLQMTKPDDVGDIGDPVAIFKLTCPDENQRQIVVAVFPWLNKEYIGLEILDSDCGQCDKPDGGASFPPLPPGSPAYVLRAEIMNAKETYNTYIFCSGLETEEQPAPEPTPAKATDGKSK